MLRRALATIGVHEDEVGLLAPALALSFLAVGASIVATIASESLFVSTFSLGDLSRFSMVSSALRVVVAMAYGALANRFVAARLDTAVLAATALELLASAALAMTGARELAYLVCVLQATLPQLLPLVAFNAVAGCFQGRRAKRLLPLVAAAATIGTMAVGVFARLFATRLGTGPLLGLGALLALATLPLPLRIAKQARSFGQPTLLRGQGLGILTMVRGTVADLRDVQVVRLVVAIAAIAAAASNFVDFAFKSELKAAYARDEMAAFLGSFFVLSNGLVLLAQLFLAGRVVERYGVRMSLAAFPVTLLGAAPAVAFLPSVAAGVGAKLGEQISRYALGASTADLILTPAPSPVRTRAKVFVKGIAGPLGALASGAILSAFGDRGPSSTVLGALLFACGVIGLYATRRARAAYTSALSSALGEDRVSLDVSPASAGILKNELVRMLRASAMAEDAAGASRILAILSDRVFSLEDVVPALAAAGGTSPAAITIRKAAVRAALQLARSGDGDRLLALVGPDDDPEIERDVLAGARELGARVPRERLDRAIQIGLRADDAASAELWADAEVALAAHDRPTALRALRRAALGVDSPRRAAALRGLGLVEDRQAVREVLRGMSSEDPRVFAEAASAAVRIDAQGAIESLVDRLSTGPHVHAAARALALAGPRAVNALVAALPTTRGERSILPTAVATGERVTGTIRAARVLARLGPQGCARALERFDDLGYRARNAIARSFASVSQKTGRAIDREVVLAAMDRTVRYAEGLVAGLRNAPPGLLRIELHHRVEETGERVLDLATAVSDRALIAQARLALARDERNRANALELLENLLPRELASRTVSLLDAAAEEPAPPSRRAPALSDRYDGWLAKCAQFDAGELPSGDPMITVLEKVLVLRDSSLFAGLSGEELYPVAEIAEPISVAAGNAVVREGDPGDALFVVASGKLWIEKAGNRLRAIERGAVFGELALLDGSPRAASVVADSDGRLLRIPRAEFEALLDESPELSRGVIRTLLGHLRGGA